MSTRLFLNLRRLPLAFCFAAIVIGGVRASAGFHRRGLLLDERSESSRSPIGLPKCDPKGPKDILRFTSAGQVLGFAADAFYVAGGSHALRVQFVEAHPSKPVSLLASGNAQSAAPLSQITYPNLWEGVTVTYDAPSGAVVRSTYRVEPHADANNIRLRYNAPFAVQGDGSLCVTFQSGTINESAPEAWQERDGKRVPVRIAFAPRGNAELTFALGDYDRNEPLFIDPTLTWNTFLGGARD